MNHLDSVLAVQEDFLLSKELKTKECCKKHLSFRVSFIIRMSHLAKKKNLELTFDFDQYSSYI